jgi:CxxC motif-containing protein (DUF1111 family)/predicted lipoprotein with Yx(FWY)xxD motif
MPSNHQTPLYSQCLPSVLGFVSRARSLVLTVVLALCGLFVANAHAYDVEQGSTGNQVFILLMNENPSASFESISLSSDATGMVDTAVASIVPSSVAIGGSALAAIDFDISQYAPVGAQEDLVITASGLAGGQPVDVVVTIPLTMVSSAASAQGFFGATVPSPDPGGVDTDGDGVSDALEISYGSNPNNAQWLPGLVVEENVPLLGVMGAIVLAALFLSVGSSAARRQKMSVLALAVVMLLPLNMLAGSATRIQVVASIPIPPPPPPPPAEPELLSATATSSTNETPATLASYAVDENMATRWSSQFSDDQWLTLDLGAVYSLSEVIIHWEAANAATYEMQGSNDNSSWTPMAGESGGTFGNRTDTVALAGSYRYVRMQGLTRSSAYGYSIFEIEVWGIPASDEDGDGVDDSLDQCAGTPAGTAVAANGCPDSDGDGVNDGIDQCSSTPFGTLVDATGCVVVDTDNDGVPDNAPDLCPNTPPGANVNNLGCTIVIPVNEVASINDILVGGSGSSQPGFTLYVWDNDPTNGGVSNCNGGCATSWPPLLVTDGVASGVADLASITRNDGTEQVTYAGRPLYFYISDNAVGDTNGDSPTGTWHKVDYSQLYAPLFDNTSVLEPDTQYETADALVTRWSDRPRTRHAREDQFQSYDHYVKFYFEDRSTSIEIVDYVAKGGTNIEMNVRTIWPLNATEAENRWWYAGPSATYHWNSIMDYMGSEVIDGTTYYHYQKTGDFYRNANTRGIQMGDRLEFEVSQFSAPGITNGQLNYYGTVFLYIVGEGIVPWYAKTGDEASEKIPEEYWLGGDTTIHYQYSDEPNDNFLQMATNLGYDNGQTFLLGRRVHHSSFVSGAHDEDPENGVLSSNAGLTGPRYINERCSDCHERNGGASVVANGELLDRWVFKVGDANGNPHPNLGSVLQPKGSASEGNVSIASWTESNGLRSPNYQFAGVTPDTFSARIAPRLVGLGLLEAIVEADIEALADPTDLNGDGVSGRVNVVTDAVTGQNRIGRFGWKAAQPSVRHQAASALNTDIGVRTSMFPSLDCGSAQTNCNGSAPQMPEENLDTLTLYLSALGVRPQRVWQNGVADQDVLQGRELFRNIGCVGCHTETFQTSEFHPLAEVRDQTIHPYSDMLLHDMGPGLADTLSEGTATGAEWRTTPLWGLGLAACVTGGVINPTGAEGGESCTPHHAYLHDGRARSIEEAILWHGGEGQAANDAYQGLLESDKQLMLRFLESL